MEKALLTKILSQPTAPFREVHVIATLKKELEILKPLLANVTCPVVIIHAPNDILVPYENVAFMEANFPKETIHSVIKIPEKNNFIPWNAEKEIRSAIEGLMGTI